MKKITKIFAAVLILLTVMVTGCQSNEQKYTQLKTETVKLMEQIDKEETDAINKFIAADPRNRYQSGKQMKIELEIKKKHLPKVKENIKKMEELSKSELKLANDFRMTKAQTLDNLESGIKYFEKHTKNL